jgi:hypothetical protein
MPRALLFQQVLEAAGGLLRVVFRRALDNRDSVFWLALAIGIRVVAAATALVPVVVVVAARVLLALATDGVILGVSLVFSSAQEVIMSLRWCRMDLPGPATSVGTRTDYSVGPWDYPACAARHLKAWSTRTTQE